MHGSIGTVMKNIYSLRGEFEYNDCKIFPMTVPYLRTDQLLTELENYEVGKPSTYPSTFLNIEKNVTDGFIKKIDNCAYEICEIGEDFLNQFSQLNDPFFDLKNSAEFESDLQKISEGEFLREDFEKKYFSIFPEHFLEKINIDWINKCE